MSRILSVVFTTSQSPFHSLRFFHTYTLKSTAYTPIKTLLPVILVTQQFQHDTKSHPYRHAFPGLVWKNWTSLHRGLISPPSCTCEMTWTLIMLLCLNGCQSLQHVEEMLSFDFIFRIKLILSVYHLSL